MFPYHPSPRTFDAAARDLTDPKAKVRTAAVRDLARFAALEERRDAVIEGLCQALDDDEPGVRAEAALAAADVEASEAVPQLVAACEDESLRVRQMALTALGELGDPRGLEPIRAALGDEVPAVRFQAVMAFARVCPDRARATAALVEATHDDDDLVCHVALRMGEELGPDEGQRGEGAPVVPDSLLERATALLEHDSPIVRVASAVVVARSGGQEADRTLIDVANGELQTDQADDEATALELCGQRDLREAVGGLEKRAFPSLLSLRQDPLAWHARVALAATAHPRAVQWILRELQSWNRARRSLAVAAAGKARLAAATGVIREMQGHPRRADPDAVSDALAALAADEGQP